MQSTPILSVEKPHGEAHHVVDHHAHVGPQGHPHQHLQVGPLEEHVPPKPEVEDEKRHAGQLEDRHVDRVRQRLHERVPLPAALQEDVLGQGVVEDV